jgi:hypothetical protein
MKAHYVQTLRLSREVTWKIFSLLSKENKKVKYLNVAYFFQGKKLKIK